MPAIAAIQCRRRESKNVWPFKTIAGRRPWQLPNSRVLMMRLSLNCLCTGSARNYQDVSHSLAASAGRSHSAAIPTGWRHQMRITCLPVDRFHRIAHHSIADEMLSAPSFGPDTIRSTAAPLTIGIFGG